MDDKVFLQRLCDMSLEEGCAYIQAHASEFADHATIAVLMREESLRQRHINAFVSLKLAELLIFLGEHLQHAPTYAFGLLAKGDALSHVGHYQAALECLNSAGEKFLQLGDELNWAHTRISWVIASVWLGQVEEALQEAAHVRGVFLQYGEHYWVCIVDHNTAVIYKRLGRYQDALNLYKRILSVYPTLSYPGDATIKLAIASAEANQAINLSLLGNFERAHHLLQQAQERFNALGQTSAVVRIEIHLAEIDYAQGYYGSALKRYYQARDSLLQNQIDDPMLLAELKLHMTDCLVKLNKPQEACQLAVEAIKLYRQHGVSLDTGEALREYATALVAAGQLRKALSALEEAWILFKQGSFDHYASDTRLQQAELLLEMGSVTEAHTQAGIVKQYFETKGLVLRSARATLVMAAALIENAQQSGVYQEAEQRSLLLQEAELLCKQTMLQARRHNLQEQIYKSQYLLGRLAHLEGKPGKAARRYGAAIAQIERILHDLGYDLSPSFLHTTSSVYGDMITLCLQQSQVERAFNYLEQARSLALRQYLNKSSALQDNRREQEDVAFPPVSSANNVAVLRMRQELTEWQQEYRKYSAQLATIDSSVSHAVDQEVMQAELNRCEAKLNELFERLHLHQAETRSTPHTLIRVMHKAQRVDVAQLRQHLLPDQLLLAYFLYKGRLIIFAVTPERLVVYENPGGATQLERLYLLLHAHLQPDGWPNPQLPPQYPIRRVLNKLYDLLVAPVAHLLPPSSGHLTIVPYGPLHKLPFHALFDGSHFLVEDFQINYLPASSILAHLSAHRVEPPIRPIDSKVPIKPPLVFGYSQNGYLQRVLDEARTLTTLLGGRCYLEGNATIAQLIEQAPGSPIIHVATHGQSRLDSPNFSCVHLADGYFNAIDALSLNLEECELITLSGCETGLALSGGGDEQLGLGRAFLAAGVPSLVMSLWPVEDNATNELMQLFYQNLLNKDSKVQALRTAQCSLLHRTSSCYAHPYFWAAFRLVGDVGPLKYAKARAFTPVGSN
jgi:CHAT domain-containing protein